MVFFRIVTKSLFVTKLGVTKLRLLCTYNFTLFSKFGRIICYQLQLEILLLFVQHERAFQLQLLFLFFITLGPPLPKGLESFSMLQIHGDAYIFGGSGGGYNSAIYKLTCSSGICSWSTINQELKVGRKFTVAIPVPNTFCVY